MADTSIEWTRGDDGTPGKTWNPLRGCSVVSSGCVNCYAMRTAHRFSGPGRPYEGLTKVGPKGPVWTGEIRLVPEKLEDPLRWRKPRRVFVNSMSDLFHEDVPNEYIAAVFGVMAACPQHTFQLLTKRPGRALEWFEWLNSLVGTRFPGKAYPDYVCAYEASQILGEGSWMKVRDCGRLWPPPNVHLGVSVEDQQRADGRIPILLQIPTAVRWVSVEPMIGPVELHMGPSARLRWVVVGGESGPGARPCRIEWIRSIVEQCKAADVSCYVKQLGARPTYRVDSPMGDELSSINWPTTHPKGGDFEEFPDDLKVRESPA